MKRVNVQFVSQLATNPKFRSIQVKSAFSQKDTYLALSFLFNTVLLSCYHHLKAKFGNYFALASISMHFWMVWEALENGKQRMEKVTIRAEPSWKSFKLKPARLRLITTSNYLVTILKALKLVFEPLLSCISNQQQQGWWLAPPPNHFPWVLPHSKWTTFLVFFVPPRKLPSIEVPTSSSLLDDNKMKMYMAPRYVLLPFW